MRHSLHHLVLAISLVAFSLLWANNITFNFALICIQPSPPANGTNNFNGSSSSSRSVSTPIMLLSLPSYINFQDVTHSKEKFTHDFSANQRNILISGAAIGAMFTSLWVMRVVSLIGIRRTSLLFGIASAFSCLLMPTAVSVGFIPTLLLRMVQGSAHPIQFIMLSHLVKEWSPLSSSGTFALIFNTQFQLGPLFLNPTSGVLCESQWGWPAIYYLQGTLTLFVFAAFYAIFRDTPKEHPWISNEELSAISKDKPSLTTTITTTRHRPKVPYGKMFRDPVMLLVLATFWAADVGFLVFTVFGPIYLNKAIGLNVMKTGYISAMPLMCSMLGKLIAGPINDRLPWKNERIRINIFAVASQGGTLVSYVALALLPMFRSIPEWVFYFVYTAAITLSGLDFIGVIKCSQRVSHHFSSTIMAWESMLSNFSIFTLPIVIQLVAPNNKVEEWGRVLLGIAFLDLVTLSLFLAFCDANPRPWSHFVEAKTSETTLVERSSRKGVFSVRIFHKY